MKNFSVSQWKHIHENLLDDIEEQKCVLFIGPEVVNVGGKPIQEYLYQNLTKNYPDDIAFFYDKDGLFLFKDKLAKEDVQRALRRQLKQIINQGNQLDETTFVKIASIPFHLVISINPDTYLSDIALKYGLSHRFTYFNHRGDSNNDVELPTAKQPLYYNLCGAKHRDDSFVLDYDDLFSLLQASIGMPGLPERLRRTIQTAKSFLFLGFRFDRWYAQLLLRLLSGERAIKKIALQTDLADSATHTFLVQQFQVQFLGEESTFFNDLYQNCIDKKIIREPIEPRTAEQQQIIRHLQNAEIFEALDLIIKSIDINKNTEQYHQAVMLQSRFSNLSNSNAKGTLDYREHNIEFNKIVDLLLELNKTIRSI
jgi:hypothetical protein